MNYSLEEWLTLQMNIYSSLGSNEVLDDHQEPYCYPRSGNRLHEVQLLFGPVILRRCRSWDHHIQVGLLDLRDKNDYHIRDRCTSCLEKQTIQGDMLTNRAF